MTVSGFQWYIWLYPFFLNLDTFSVKALYLIIKDHVEMQNHRINSAEKRIPRVSYRTSPCYDLPLCVRAGPVFFAHKTCV